MSAAISVLAADDTRSAAVLHGTFESDNRWFLAKHLDELDGDVVIDLRHVEHLDDASTAALRAFCERATGEGRRVVLRCLPQEVSSALSSDDA